MKFICHRYKRFIIKNFNTFSVDFGWMERYSSPSCNYDTIYNFCMDYIVEVNFLLLFVMPMMGLILYIHNLSKFLLTALILFYFLAFQKAEDNSNLLTWVILVILICIEDSIVLDLLVVENLTYFVNDEKQISHF